MCWTRRLGSVGIISSVRLETVVRGDWARALDLVWAWTVVRISVAHRSVFLEIKFLKFKNIFPQSFENYLVEIMGAHLYQQSLWRHKQSDAMRYQLRLKCFNLRQREQVHRLTRPSVPARARSLGYKAKQGNL